MPEIRHYVVKQEREVKVTANSLADAILIASAAFEHGQNSDSSVSFGRGSFGVWGNTSSQVKETKLHGDRIS